MQVQCSKCSKPIALTDIIESHDGLLSHVDCKRPQSLTPEERALVFVYCSGHVVARCPICDVSYRYNELAADILSGSRTNLCPRCRQDLTEAVRAHLFRCAMLPSEVRRRAQEVREAAQRLVKESQQLRDTADVLIREAEATLFMRQRALREAMSKRATS
jgi:transposase-like protein